MKNFDSGQKENVSRGTLGHGSAVCSNCRKPLEAKRVGKYRYCLACHAEYMRLHRPKYSDLTPEQKEKADARSVLKMNVRRGKVEKKPCIVCGSSVNLEAHHNDDSNPLDVTWYCRKHHKELLKMKRNIDKLRAMQQRSRDRQLAKRLTQEQIQKKFKQKNAMNKRAAAKKKESKADAKAVTEPYFDYHMRTSRGRCENCGSPIPAWQKRMTIAHILPKRKEYGFPSVAGVLANMMQLCVHKGCHNLYDRSWEDAVQMPVFELAKERFKEFEHLIAPEERSRIPVVFVT